MTKNIPYVFIIGFNKTATRSLHELFAKSGFPSIHWDDGKLALRMIDNLVAERKIMAGYDHKYRVFSDLCYVNSCISFQTNQHFRIMDRDYPGSYFIYNYRSEANWLRSRSKHSAGNFLRRNMRVYNTQDPAEVEQLWLTERRRFEEDIRAYFRHSDKYLELDIENDDVCAKIAGLLGMSISASAWRHVGKTAKQALDLATS